MNPLTLWLSVVAGLLLCSAIINVAIILKGVFI